MKNSETTGTKSHAQMSFPWVFRNVDQDCPDGDLERAACMYFWIVRFATLIFNFNNSPRIRSAPHNGFSLAIGLINRLVPADRFEEEVRDFAGQLAKQPRQALAAAKRAVNHALESSYEEALEFESYLQEAQAATPEFAEMVQAFLARRAAKK